MNLPSLRKARPPCFPRLNVSGTQSSCFRLPSNAWPASCSGPHLTLSSAMQENSGNDPNTQLVPASGGFKGSWQKTEEPQTAVGDARGSGLSAGSTWAASQAPGGKGQLQSWQPPEGPYFTSSASGQRDRQLNPHEYPSLATAATARPNFAKQPVPSVPFASHQVRSQRDALEPQQALQEPQYVQSTQQPQLRLGVLS